MGYMGHCKIGGTQYLITGSSLNPVQTVEAPDLVQGFYMRKGWNYGKVEIGGNVTGPLHEFATTLWNETIDRTTDGDHLDNVVEVEIAYYKGIGRKFSNCYINSLEISATAGDVVSFTVDFIGAKQDEDAAASTAVDCLTSYSEGDCSKLVTWDRVSVNWGSVSTAIENTQSMTLTVNNNLERQYSIHDGTADLFPIDVTAGIREVTGTVSLYAEGPICLGGGTFDIAKFGANDFDDYANTDRTTIQFSIGGASGGGDIIPSTSIDVVFNRPESSAVTGPTIYTLNFTAVCDLSV
jgi:hypothetical protein